MSSVVRVAKALIIDSDGYVLILRRSNTHPYLALHHDLPGGEVEFGEQPSRAVVREIYEETGLEVDVSQLRVRYENTATHDAKQVHILYEVHLDTIKPSVTISWEHDKAEWLLPHEVIARGHYGPGYDSYYTMAVQQLQLLQDTQE